MTNNHSGQGTGALSGSREPSRVSPSRPVGFDPERMRWLANECEAADPLTTGAMLRRAFEAIYGPRPERILGGSPELDDWFKRFNPFYRLSTDGGHLDAAKLLLAPRTLWAVGSMEDGPFARLCWPMPNGTYGGGYVEGQAENSALSLCAAALRGHAIAMEAREGTDPTGLGGEAATARAEGIARNPPATPERKVHDQQ